MTHRDLVVYLPATGDRPSEPAPYLLTEEETIRLLRLECEDPYSCLRRYRLKGWRKATQVGKHVRFALPNVLRFIDVATEENPR